MTIHTKPFAGPALPIALATTLVVMGCDSVGPAPRTLTLQVESVGDSPVRLITSSDFTVQRTPAGEPEFDFDQADTTWVDSPFADDFDLRATGMFYARAAEVEEPDAVVTMRALLDGTETYFHEGVLTGPGPQYYFTLF